MTRRDVVLVIVVLASLAGAVIGLLHEYYFLVGIGAFVVSAGIRISYASDYVDRLAADRDEITEES